MKSKDLFKRFRSIATSPATLMQISSIQHELWSLGDLELHNKSDYGKKKKTGTEET